MGEIFWAKTHERRDHLKSHDYGEMPADRRTTVFASKDKVCLVDSALMVGAPRKSTKRYYYWRTHSSIGFFRNRAGHLQPYRAMRPLNSRGAWRSFYPEEAFYYLEEDEEFVGEAMRAFRAACSEYLRLYGVYDLYPMAKTMDMPERFKLLPANLRPHMRVTNWNEFMTSAFGKTRATPKFINAAQETEPYVIALAHEFRGLVADNELVKFMKRTQFDEQLMDNFKPHTPRLRRYLRRMDATSRRNLLYDPINVSTTTLIKYASDQEVHHRNGKGFRNGPLTGLTNWTALTRVI